MPYTNNVAEGDIRVAKIYQNISKCFRTVDGARRFCLIRGYIITARKYGMDATDALEHLFNKDPPFFMRNELPYTKELTSYQKSFIFSSDGGSHLSSKIALFCSI